jgi:hypothetical protein
MDELLKATHKLAEEIYKQTAAQQEQKAGSKKEEFKGEEKGKEHIVDAEFKEEGDDEKKRRAG